MTTISGNFTPPAITENNVPIPEGFSLPTVNQEPPAGAGQNSVTPEGALTVLQNSAGVDQGFREVQNEAGQLVSVRNGPPGYSHHTIDSENSHDGNTYFSAFAPDGTFEHLVRDPDGQVIGAYSGHIDPNTGEAVYGENQIV